MKEQRELSAENQRITESELQKLINVDNYISVHCWENIRSALRELQARRKQVSSTEAETARKCAEIAKQFLRDAKFLALADHAEKAILAHYGLEEKQR